MINRKGKVPVATEKGVAVLEALEALLKAIKSKKKAKR
jgi:hypothetical protein